MKTLMKTGRLFKTVPGFCKAFFVFFIIILPMMAGIGNAQRSIVIPYEGTIVIDPGHGGRDQGARGALGLFEKEIVLNLARLIAGQIDKKYQVLLTRTDDYWLDLPDRTGVANHARAALFISLHAGGSFLRQAAGLTVYCYEDLYKPMVSSGPETSHTPPNTETADRWDDTQNKHAAASRRLATLLQERLGRFVSAPAVALQGAPLMVLKGAAMPAVVIEIGYLTNPVDEKKLQDPQALNDLAALISDGIHEFLAKSP